MSTVKREVYTSQQPDGTLVTTTTTTKTRSETAYDYTTASLNIDYCCTPAAILRILQIICGFIIVACVSAVFGPSFSGVLHGQTFVLITVCLLICITFILLVIFFLGMHTTHLSEMPWRAIDLTYSIIAVILLIVAGCLEAYYSSGTWWPNCNRYNAGAAGYTACPTYVAWIVAAVFCFIGAILYIIGAYFAWKKRYYL